MGRPSTFTDQLADEILDRVSGGEPLAQVCRDDHMPSVSTFREWMRNREAISVRFAHAREDGFDMLAIEALQAARNGGNNPQHAKVLADTILKLLAKWDARYADNMQIRHANHEGGNLRDVSESEAAAKVASILEAVRRRAVPLLSGDA